MSHLDARFATNKITVWRADTDSFSGDESFSRVGVFDATWINGQKTATDDAGNEFMPKGVYTLDGIEDVKRNDVIARGEHVGENPIALGFNERVRTITIHDGSFFNWDDSLVLMTS